MSARTFNVVGRDALTDLVVAAQRGDTISRDEAVAANMRFVIHLARKLAGVSPILDADDLATEGALGLLRAMSTFDPSRDIHFLTYAGPWVKQFVWRAIARTRGHLKTAIPLEYNVASGRYARVRRKLEAGGLDGEALTLAIAKALKVSREWALAMETLSHSKVASLDAPVADGSDRALGDVVPADNPWADERLARARLRFRVARKVDRLRAELDPREAAILTRRLYVADGGEEATLGELAEPFDLTRERIRQIEQRLIGKLRVIFAKEHDELCALDGRGAPAPHARRKSRALAAPAPEQQEAANG